MATKVKLKGGEEFYRDLLKVVDLKTIHKRLREDHVKAIVVAVITSAEQGMGPGDKPYPPITEAYAKRKGTGKGWLRGIGREGKTGGMLDPKNFSIEVDSGGKAFLVWTAPDARAAIYGEVHQDGTDKMPQRMWLHFENTQNAERLVAAYHAVLDVLAAMFSAGRTPK